MTEKQLAEWGVKYHVLRCGVKFFAEEYIDDRGHNADTWFPPETYTDDYGTWYSCNGEPVLD
jgi:hypothetical protein